MTTFTLEPIGEEDFAFRYRVYEAAIKPYIDAMFDWDEEQHRALIRDTLTANSHHAAIVVEGERVGVTQIEETEDRTSLHQVAILPAYQGKGIGTALVRSLQDQSQATGKPIHLSVFQMNVGAQRLYERLGFRVVSSSERDVQMTWTPPGAGDRY
jgi:ribosomal protein S18 acetylase RimI-like enzyme